MQKRSQLRFRRSLRAAAAAIAISVPNLAIAAGTVHVVDPNGGSGVFLDVSQAVNQAVDGDTILVKSGVFNNLTIDGKSLTVVSDSAAVSYAQVTIRNLSPSQSVTVRRFTSAGLLFVNTGPVVIENCQGAVVLERATVEQFLGNADYQTHGISIKNCDRVSLIRCQIKAIEGTSGSGGFYGSSGGAAVYATGSSVAIYDSTLQGGDGGNATSIFGVFTATSAGPGLWAADGMVLASGSSFTGGDGGFGGETSPGACDLPNSNGGDGISLFPSGELTLLDCTTIGGSAGVVASGCTPVGLPGVAVDTGISGVAAYVNEVARSFEVSSPAREGGLISLTTHGSPNELTFLLVSPMVDGNLVFGLFGGLLPGTPLTVLAMPSLDGAGFSQTVLTVPTVLPASIDAIDVYLQAVMPGSFGTGVLSSGSVATIVKSGF